MGRRKHQRRHRSNYTRTRTYAHTYTDRHTGYMAAAETLAHTRELHRHGHRLENTRAAAQPAMSKTPVAARAPPPAGRPVRYRGQVTARRGTGRGRHPITTTALVTSRARRHVHERARAVTTLLLSVSTGTTTGKQIYQAGTTRPGSRFPRPPTVPRAHTYISERHAAQAHQRRGRA